MPTAGEMRQIKDILDLARQRIRDLEAELKQFKEACAWYEAEIKRLNQELGREP